MDESNSRARKARETKFVPESALDIPASENQSFSVAEGKLHTGNDQQVGLLRTLLKSIPMEFLYTQLSKKQRQSKDVKITLRMKLDFYKFDTIGKPVSRALTTVSFVKLTIL